MGPSQTKLPEPLPTGARVHTGYPAPRLASLGSGPQSNGAPTEMGN